MHQRTAFTAIELMMVMVVVAIVIAFTTSDEDNGSKEQARLAAEKLEADVAYARSVSIARPDDPIVIKIDQTNNRYWLASAANQNVPMVHPRSGKPYLVSFGAGGTAGMEDVKIVGSVIGHDQTLAFDSMGRTDQQSAALIQLAVNSVAVEVSVSQTSGKTTVQHMLNLPNGYGGPDTTGGGMLDLGGGPGGGSQGVSDLN